jgi:hypothetical protein
MVIHRLFVLNPFRISVTVYNTCFHHNNFMTISESIHCFKIHFVTEIVGNFVMKLVRIHINLAGKISDFNVR